MSTAPALLRGSFCERASTIFHTRPAAAPRDNRPAFAQHGQVLVLLAHRRRRGGDQASAMAPACPRRRAGWRWRRWRDDPQRRRSFLPSAVQLRGPRQSPIRRRSRTAARDDDNSTSTPPQSGASTGLESVTRDVGVDGDGDGDDDQHTARPRPRPRRRRGQQTAKVGVGNGALRIIAAYIRTIQ